MKHLILSLTICMTVLLAQAQERIPVQVQAQQAEKENPLNLASSDEKIAIYPNPSNGVFTISVANLDARKVDLRIMNVIGNEILHETLVRTDAQFSKTIDLNRYAKGLYYVKLEADGYSTVRRVVVK
ncbi:T9SS type A sorting domain-containing protein [Pontibacter sp. E15-1]|uniref:T9SS type A sorting domain-containing protein n=1 Tax=Pontibacter sp. E15-1 TaxID=2919918 RepID=UPI001F4FF485|nr:T9SS type A sorting domain-containing protein [Pontibacter sp. E15-1]MCJ8165452.1 T9SS type A sorting domain-containing protein [Pontibacter sp. E15-1]